MSRLTHSTGGFLRSLQMSTAQVFAFVEGGLDRPFFDRLLRFVCAPRSVRYQVIAVREVPGSPGGKPALVTLFRTLRHSGYLRRRAFGKTLICTFFADKDCDDAARRRVRSDHFFYTATYDLEAHLYSCGDLQRAVADACGLTLEQATRAIPDQQSWLRDVCENWKDWTALCLISALRRVNCGCTYDRPSAINPTPHAPPDGKQLASFKTRLARTLGLPQGRFDRVFAEAVRRIDTSFRQGIPLRYFKGKWLHHLLQRYLEALPRVPDASFNSAGEKVAAALLAQVAGHPTCQCCAPYSDRLARLVAAV